MLDWLLINIALWPTIIINSTNPCFLNYTAGIDIFQNCGVGTDYIQATLYPWLWVTGGYFAMILVSIFVLISWIKYQKVVYPIITGCMFLPISYYFFPNSFLSISIILAVIAMGLLVYHAFISQTNET